MIRLRNSAKVVSFITGTCVVVASLIPLAHVQAELSIQALSPSNDYVVDTVGIANMNLGRVVGTNTTGSTVLVEKSSPAEELVVVDVATEVATTLTGVTEDGCAANEPNFSAALSADGSKAAWVNSLNQLWVRSTAGGAPTQVGVNDIWCPGIVPTVALDADGSHVAYVRHRVENGVAKAQLVVHPVGGAAVLVETVDYSLQNSGSDIVAPVLSANGSRVAYAVYDPNNDGWFLRVKDVAGPTTVGTDRRLDDDSTGPNIDASLRPPSMSADGATLAWVETVAVDVSTPPSPPMFQPQGKLHVGAVTATSGTEITPLANSDMSPKRYGIVTIAPSGGAIVFTAHPSDASLPGSVAFRLSLPAASNTVKMLAIPPGVTSPQSVSSIVTDNDASHMAYSLYWLENGAPRQSVVSVVPAAQGTLSRPTVEWSVPTSGGWATIGANVSISSQAPSDADSVVATIATKQWNGNAVVATDVPVTMTAGSPGSYSATWAIPEGTSEVTGVSVTATRGASSSSRTSGSPAVTVAGAVAITAVSTPAAGFYLTLSNAQTGFTVRQTVTDGAGASLPVVVPGTYQLKLFESTGRERSSQSVTVSAGRTTTIAQVQAAPLGSLTVTINGDGGSLVGTWLALTTPNDQFIANGFITTGNQVSFDGLTVGDTVKVKVKNLPRLMSALDTNVVIQQSTSATVVASPPATTTLAGVLRRSDMRPASGATLTLSQWTGFDFRTASTRVGTNGAYSLTILDGVANTSFKIVTWSVEYNGSYATGQIDLTNPGPNPGNITLTERSAEAVVVTIQYQGATGTPPRLDDWRAFRHNWITTRLNSKPYPFPIAAPPTDGNSSGVFNVVASNGDIFEVCADGAEAGYGKACNTVVINTNLQSHSLTVTLPQQTRFQARLMAAGTPVTQGAMWLLYKQINSEWVLQYTDVVIPDSDGNVVFSHDSGNGNYRVELLQGVLFKSVQFAVSAVGDVKNLGTVQLESQQWFVASSSFVTSDRSEAAIGSRLSLRLELKPATDLTGVDVKIPVPTGLSLVTGSVLKNGTPVANGSISVANGLASVSLGNLTAATTYVIRYQVDIAGGYSGGVVPTAVDTSFVAVGFGAQTAQIPGAVVNVVAVTIDLPANIQSLEVPVSGRAPANQLVTLTSRGATLGGATASSNGAWKTTIRLPDRGSSADYSITASVTQPASSQVTAGTRFDTATPIVTRACLSQPDPNKPRPGDAEYCFDPRRGVAVFPFVFVPNLALRIELTVDRPSLVDEAIVHVGSKSAVAIKQGDGKLLASVMGDGRGALEIELVGRRDPQTIPLNYLQTLAAQLSPQTPGLSNDEKAILDVLVPGGLTNPTATITSQTATAMSVSVNADPNPSQPFFGQASGTNSVDLSIEQRVVTAQDAADVALTGLPFYGVGVQSVTQNGQVGRIVTAYMDLDEVGILPQRDGALSPLDVDAITPQNALIGRAASVLKVTWKYFQPNTQEGVFNLSTTVQSAIASGTAGGKYGELMKLQDSLGGCLSPGKIQFYNSSLDSTAEIAAFLDVAGAGLNVVGLLLAPETFGLGTIALWGVGYGFGLLSDYLIEKETSRIQEWIREDQAKCQGEAQARRTNTNSNYVGRRNKIGDPRWIYDPSGYAYEGAEDIRIPGVTATLLYSANQNGPFEVFDIAPYGQVNPLVTNAEGRYAWDVPEGWWKVYFTKSGYEPAFSRTVQVLPPHFDVHVSMRKTTAPVVASYAASLSGIDVTFDQPMRTSSISPVATVSANGQTLTGTWIPVSPKLDANNVPLASTFRFVPTGGVAASTTYTVAIGVNVQDHTGRAMVADASGTATSPAPVVGGGGGGGGPTAGGALPGVPVSLAGDDRVATALAIVEADFDEVSSVRSADTIVAQAKRRAESAVIVSASSFADSLSAGPLAVAKNGPLFLTNGASLDARVASSLTRFVPRGSTVFIVGGEVAVSTAVENAVRALGFTVLRLAGVDRFETSVMVAVFGLGAPSTAVLATGLDFPDGLTAGVVAGRNSGAVLLTRGDALPTIVADYLRDQRPTSVIAVGGPAARAYPTARALQGADRYDTAAAVAVAYPPTGAVVGVASGRSFPDGLAAAPYLARRGSVLLLTSDSSLALPTSTFIRGRRPSVTTVQVFGGLSAVPDSIRRSLSDLFG